MDIDNKCIDSLDLLGEFWICKAGNIQKSGGSLSWVAGGPVRLDLDSIILEEQMRQVSQSSTGCSIAHSGAPAAVVADSRSHLLMGSTDAGNLTLIKSRLRGCRFDAPPSGQSFEADVMAFGALLEEGLSTPLSGVRIVHGRGLWWPQRNPRLVQPETGGLRLFQSATGEVWLQYDPVSEFSLQMALRFVSQIETLTRLAFGLDFGTSRIQVRLLTGEWIDIAGRIVKRNSKSLPSPNCFLQPGSLTIEMLDRWLELGKIMDGLSEPIASPIDDHSVQVRTMVACSLLEGVHKRVSGEERMSYFGRVSEFAQRARRVDENVTCPIEDWPKLVKDARNDLMHHNKVHSIETQFLRWLIVAMSVNWVLRLILLQEVGLTDEKLASALQSHQPYGLYREYMALYVEELASMTQ